MLNGCNSSKGEISLKISSMGKWSKKVGGLGLTKEDGRCRPKLKLGENLKQKFVIQPDSNQSNHVHLVKGVVDEDGRYRPKL